MKRCPHDSHERDWLVPHKGKDRQKPELLIRNSLMIDIDDWRSALRKMIGRFFEVIDPPSDASTVFVFQAHPDPPPAVFINIIQQYYSRKEIQSSEVPPTWHLPFSFTLKNACKL